MKGRNLGRIFTLLLALVMLVTVVSAMAITAFAEAPASYTDIYLDSPQYVSVSGSGRYYRFIPEVSGMYKIYSYSNTNDPRVYLLDSSGNQIDYNDDGGNNGNFLLNAQLDAGTVYYINANSWSSSARYTFEVELVEAYTPTVSVYTDAEISYGAVADFYVHLRYVDWITDIEITPVFDESIFEYVGGEWLIYGDSTTGLDGMKASISYGEEMSVDGQFYKFSLRAKTETDSTDVSVSASIHRGEDGLRIDIIGANTAVAPCNHYYGTSVEIDENYHEFTCDACGQTITREHMFSDENDRCCNDGCGYHRGLVGDVDGDGLVGPEDALWLIDYYYDNYWSYTMSVGYDFNGTGYVDEYDAYNLLMYVFFPDTVICDCGERPVEDRALKAPAASDDIADGVTTETLHPEDWVYVYNYSDGETINAMYGAYEITYDESVMELANFNYSYIYHDDNEIVYQAENRLVFAFRSERSIYLDDINAEFRVLSEPKYGNTDVNSNVRICDGDNNIISETNITRNYFISCWDHVFVENPAEEYLKKAASCKSKATYYLSCETCGLVSEETFKHGELADHKWTEEDGEEFCSVCDKLKSGDKRPNNSNNKNNNKSDESDINPIVIIAIAAGVVVVVVIVIIIIASGKKKKKNAAAAPVAEEVQAPAIDEASNAAPEQNADNAPEAQEFTAPEQSYAPQYGAPQGYAPQYGAQQNYAPQYGAQQNYAPQYGAQQGYAPQYGTQQGYAPQYGAQQNYAPQYGAQQNYAPQYGAQQGYAPQYGAPQGYAPQGEQPQGEDNAQQ